MIVTSENHSKSDILEKIKALGVSNPENPTPEEMKIIIEAALETRRIDADCLRNYLDNVVPTFKVIFDAIKSISSDSTLVTRDVLKSIEKFQAILGKQLERDDIATEERKYIYDQLLNCIKEARDEANSERDLKEKTLIIVSGLGLIIAVSFIFLPHEVRVLR